MRRIALVVPCALVVVLAAACSGAPGANAKISLSADRDTTAADGLSVIHITATVTPADAAAVLAFSIDGAGNVSASNAAVESGVAHVDVIAPDEDVFSGAAALSTLTVGYAPIAGIAQAPVTASKQLTFTVPSDGPAKLKAHTEPDFLVVTRGEPMHLVIEGRRVTSTTVHLSTTSAAGVVLPTTVEVTGDGPLRTADVVIEPPAARVTVPVTLDGGDGLIAHVDLHFIEEGDPEFDLNGDFVQLTYGAVRISDFPGMETQCVESPSVSLVHVTQEGNALSFTSTLCQMEMPAVTVAGFGFQPTINQSFVDATNDKTFNPLAFTLASVAAGAAFAIPGDALAHPLILGAAPANALTGALPTEGSQGTDDDHDGEVGVTIHGDGGLVGDQHICSRTITTSMTGTIESSAHVSGLLESTTETVVFEGSDASPKVTGLPSKWHLQRVDGTNGATDIGGRDGAPGVSCADVKSFYGELKAAFPSTGASGPGCEEQ